MARLYGLNGMIRGRQGNNVYSVLNGTQVLKVYQPAVANPRTFDQRMQRSKFALAGKLSSATPSSALVGMHGSSPRERRAEFVSIITRASTITLGTEGFIATIDFEKIMWSQGNIPVYSPVPTITANWTGSSGRENVRVSVPALTAGALAPAGYGEMLVIALFDGISYNLEEVRSVLRSSTQASEVIFRVGTRRDVRVCVYTVPFVPNESVLSFSSSNLYDTASAVNILGSQSTGAASNEFGNSVLLQVVTLSGATTSIAPSPADDDNRHVADPDNGDVMKTAKKK